MISCKNIIKIYYCGKWILIGYNSIRKAINFFLPCSIKFYGGGEGTVYQALAGAFTGITGYSFLVFNLLCAPCFAAIGAIKREMNSPKWTLAAIGYQCGFAYLISLIVYQIGGLITGELGFGIGTVAGVIALALLIYMLVRKNKYGDREPTVKAAAQHS